MRLYSVKAEFLYGDGSEEKLVAQNAVLSDMGLRREESRDMVICTAEEALELFHRGFCGSYASLGDIALLYTVPGEKDIPALIESSVQKAFDGVRHLFNDKCNVEQPGPNLMNVSETLLLEDCCTDVLQENLSNGWRIIAVCPQPQRRPDYVLGRAYTPQSAGRG